MAKQSPPDNSHFDSGAPSDGGLAEALVFEALEIVLAHLERSVPAPHA